MDEKLKANRRAWNEMTDRHIAGGGGYRVEEFKAAAIGTEPNIPDDIGDVAGRSMLHLQCHFGMDSLMWVRQGARVTGVDFSPRAVEEARKLSAETGLQAEFVESDIMTLPDALTGEFDIVITYYGTITWLPDITRWGEVVGHFLKPGGLFYIADTHPVAQLYDIEKGDDAPKIVRPYFTGGRAERCETEGGTYADPNAPREERVTYEWQHTIGGVIESLIGAGLRIDYLHEFPYTFYDMFYYADPSPMEQGEDGWWRMRKGGGDLPLMFSIKATKRGETDAEDS
jgi:SAM-dependent methyltransferase